jgi:hypothetical protein
LWDGAWVREKGQAKDRVREKAKVRALGVVRVMAKDLALGVVKDLVRVMARALASDVVKVQAKEVVMEQAKDSQNKAPNIPATYHISCKCRLRYIGNHN